jgi:hypothetical protein
MGLLPESHMLIINLVVTPKQSTNGKGKLTETVEDVEEAYQNDGSDINRHAEAAQRKRACWNVSSPCQDVWQEC